MASFIDYVPALKRLGLSEYEAKVYAALVKFGSKTAGELSFLSGVPRTKLYGSLRELERKGLVKILHHKPETFTASTPTEFLLPLAEKFVKEAGENLENVQSLALAYESMNLISGRKTSQKSQLTILEGRPAVSESITRLLLGSDESVEIVTSANGMVRLYKSHSKPIERLVSKGVKVRLITHVTPQNLNVAREITNILQLRPSPKLAFQTFTIDSKAVMFVEAIPDDLEADEGNDIGVISENRQIIDNYKRLYDMIWITLPPPADALKSLS